MKKDLIDIIEVGPRDGLQNVSSTLSLEQKINLIQYLLDAGIQNMEAGSFVRADRIPSMAGSDQIALHFKGENHKLWYLAPNLKGLETALSNGVKQIALFTATSETFNQKNIGLTVAQSTKVIADCVLHLKNNGFKLITNWQQTPQADNEIKLRLYISTVMGCPYEGAQKPEATINLIEQLFPLGFSQISLGDTIGVGTPSKWNALLTLIDPALIKQKAIALHCHDTYGTALTCVANGLNIGITSFDASIGGLGGCPYAAGATGNLATEDLIYFLSEEGYTHLPNRDHLLDVFAPERTGTLKNLSRAGNALLSKRKKVLL